MDQLVSADHAGLVDALCASGAVDGEWAGAFRAVPRHLFVPDAVWTGLRLPLRPVVRQDDPVQWCELVHSDVALVTQVDDGAVAPGQPGRYPTSSISQPSLVAMMLARAQLAPGHRVLEIGTGTGYNAALGHPPGAPYDRVLSTATCHLVPRAWIEQTRPGGRIVTPWASSYHNGALLHLDVTGDGAASGRFGGTVSFMWLRDQRIPFGWLAAQPAVTYQQTTTNAHPYRLNDVSASFVIGLLVPGCHYQLITRNGDPYDAVMWLFDPATGSRASVTIAPQATEFPIGQHGPRHLWDEAHVAYDWWVSAGRPDYSRFGLTVTPDGGQHAWLDSPQHPLPAPRRAP